MTSGSSGAVLGHARECAAFGGAASSTDCVSAWSFDCARITARTIHACLKSFCWRLPRRAAPVLRVDEGSSETREDRECACHICIAIVSHFHFIAPCRIANVRCEQEVPSIERAIRT